MAAAILLLLKSQATAIERTVFKLQSGVKPKKIPIANPIAIECGVSSIATTWMWIDENHFLNLANLLLKDAVSVLLIFMTGSSPEFGLPGWRSGNLPEGSAQTESGMWREIERVVIKNHMNFRSLMAELFT